MWVCLESMWLEYWLYVSVCLSLCDWGLYVSLSDCMWLSVSVCKCVWLCLTEECMWVSLIVCKCVICVSFCVCIISCGSVRVSLSVTLWMLFVRFSVADVRKFKIPLIFFLVWEYFLWEYISSWSNAPALPQILTPCKIGQKFVNSLLRFKNVTWIHFETPYIRKNRNRLIFCLCSCLYP